MGSGNGNLATRFENNTAVIPSTELILGVTLAPPSQAHAGPW